MWRELGKGGPGWTVVTGNGPAPVLGYGTGRGLTVVEPLVAAEGDERDVLLVTGKMNDLNQATSN
jgi:hypothetical protein